MRTAFKILLIILALILTSICPEKPLPEKIDLNEMCVWKTSKGIELKRGWFNYSKEKRDSLLIDAGEKINKIKNL
jgi:hypothetical protein